VIEKWEASEQQAVSDKCGKILLGVCSYFGLHTNTTVKMPRKTKIIHLLKNKIMFKPL